MVWSSTWNAPITSSTVMNRAITPGRARQAGCRVNIHSIHAAASRLRMSSIPSALGPGFGSARDRMTQKISAA